MHSGSGAVTKAVKQTKTRRSTCVAVLINKALQPLKWRNTLAGAIKQAVTGDWCRIYWIYSLRITSLCTVTNFLHQVLPYVGCRGHCGCSQLYGSYVTGIEGVQLHCLQQHSSMSKYTPVCVCICIGTYVCVGLYTTHVYICMGMNMYVYRCMHICGHTYIFIYLYLCIDIQCTYIYMPYMHIHICTYLYTCCIHYLHTIRMCIYTYVYIAYLPQIHFDMYRCVCTYIPIKHRNVIYLLYVIAKYLQVCTYMCMCGCINVSVCVHVHT